MKGCLPTLHFFTDPYKDELIYSAIARYHYYTGNLDYKDTLEECYGKRTIIPTMDIGSPIDMLSQNIGGRYTADYIINRHTILPYYIPFLPKLRREEIIHDVKYCDCKGTYNKIGIVAGGVCKKDGIYYCPICVKNEIEIYGEPFIHREHQLQGINLCAHHGTLLKKYKKTKNDVSRLEFIRLDNRLLDLSIDSKNIDHFEITLKLAKDAYWLINSEFVDVYRNDILEKYKNLLYERGLTTSSKSVKQNELYKEFSKYYGEKFLEALNCSIVNDNEYNWLRVITRNVRRVVHPIRHLLLINFLSSGVCEFFEDICKSYDPFGKGPWPCLNKIANHYMMEVVDNLSITEDYKSRLPIGTFSCKCGFVYSRKGPDRSEGDKYRIGRVKNFGSVWEEKLRGYLQERKYGLREIARLMSCDPKIIIKFDQLLGTNYFMERTKKAEKIDDGSKLGTYKNVIINVIQKNREKSRTEIRSLCKKEYTFIYRYDKEWLYESLPKQRKSTNCNKKVDWDKRDQEILILVENKYKEMINLDIPIRITKSSIGNSLGILTALEKNINKLPNTDKYLNRIIETVEEFQIRRCKKIIDKRFYSNQNIKLWEIQRIAGIRSNQFKVISKRIQNYLKDIKWKNE